ncbi:hypothetical protein ACJJTC_010884 [Scirpophaga incertulas]
MTLENKQSWTCKKCINVNIAISTSTPKTYKYASTHDLNMSPRTQSINRNESEMLHHTYNEQNQSFLSLDSNLTVRSLPDISTRDNDEIIKMAQLLSELKIKLDSANNEIDSLNIENRSLQKQLQEKECKIQQLIKISTSTTKKQKKTRKSDFTSTFNESIIKSLAQDKINVVADKIDSDEVTKINTGNNDIVAQETHKPTQEKHKRKIFIYGSQQCTGLASHLINLRKNTKYEDYSITAEIKSYASTEEILRTLPEQTVDTNDKLILCIASFLKNFFLAIGKTKKETRDFRLADYNAFYHQEQLEGLVRVTRMLLHHRYPRFLEDGALAFMNRLPCIYSCVASPLGIVQHLCRQLGLPLACVRPVPVNPSGSPESVLGSIAPVHRTGSSHRFVAPVRRTGSSHRFVAPVRRTGSSHRFVAPVRRTDSSHRFVAPVRRTGSSHRFPAPVRRTGSSHRFIAPVPRTGSSHRFVAPVHRTGSPHRFVAPVRRTGS